MSLHSLAIHVMASTEVLDELALVGDPCDSGTGASLGGDVGSGDLGWFHHGQRKVW